MHHHLNTLYQGQSLSRESTRDAFGQVVRGEVDPIVLASLLTALKIKGRPGGDRRRRRGPLGRSARLPTSGL